MSASKTNGSSTRPGEAEATATGRREPESVWDYPRPPALEESDLLAEVYFAGRVVASSTYTLRVLETSHPPVHYFPPEQVERELLHAVSERSFCEWKGVARYFDLEIDGRRSAAAAWTYPEPSARFAQLRNWIAFYPSRVDRCTLGGEIVQPQPGDFYGGWITSWLLGPFKGAPGTRGW